MAVDPEQRRGALRVFLGAAPGVGKTYAMLDEARRRCERGKDVVVGYVETHGRPHTEELLDGLEVIPRCAIDYRGTTVEEMDLDAILRRRPETVLVDELAHTNAPGSRHAKRWQDVEELLDAGIDVVTTVNIQHLESVNDVVEKITGIVQRETVPDSVVRAAEQIELRDMTAEALRRRLAHGNVYAPEKIDAALANYFRPGNLNALRELALLWTADRVDDALQHYREQHAITGTWEARERVVVALTGGPEGGTLIRRAARIAARSGAGDLVAVHVVRSDGLPGVSDEHLTRQRALVESLGGSYHQVLGEDVSAALLAFARAENATQLVLGDSRRSWWGGLISGPGVGRSTIRESGDIDVHIVTHAHSGRGLPRPGTTLPRRRRLVALVVALVLPAALALVLVPARGHLNLISDVLLFLLLTVACSLAGGFITALVASVTSFLVLNYFFTQPLHTLRIRDTNNSLALLVFVAVAITVSSTVDLAARRTREAARAAAESRALIDLVDHALGEGDVLTGMLQRIREALGLEAAALFERTEPGGWTLLATTDARFDTVGLAENQVVAGDGLVLALRGGLVRADDQRLLGAFAAQIEIARDHVRLSTEAAEATTLAAANRTRTALLAAVGHDLRTPLAAAKASVSSLLSPDVDLDGGDRDELLRAADESLDKLAALVENLLDMSRLQAGAMPVTLRPAAVDEVVARALDDLGIEGRRILLEVADDVPPVTADAGLLERVLANIVANAQRHAPADRPPLLTASRLDHAVEIRIIDRGPGIPPADRDRVFQPFQRLGDTDNTTGVGLGLALARGLTEAMGGTLEPEETPGGGLTMVVSLPVAPVAPRPEAAEPGHRERAGRAEPVG